MKQLQEFKKHYLKMYFGNSSIDTLISLEDSLNDSVDVILSLYGSGDITDGQGWEEFVGGLQNQFVHTDDAVMLVQLIDGFNDSKSHLKRTLKQIIKVASKYSISPKYVKIEKKVKRTRKPKESND